MIIKTKKEASTYKAGKEQDGFRMQKDKVKSFTKLKTWEEIENNFVQELQSRDFMFEYVKVSTFYFISYLFSSLFFFHGFRTTCKTDIINLFEKNLS